MKHQSAFTVVELSIVLVILGLLVGGVLTGQSLIHAAELRAVTTERDKYTVAFGAFRDKYLALPRDMANATAYWGALDADPSACSGIAATGLPTCNGNGDGIMGNDSYSFESFRAWQHLANAGLVEGNYSGTLAISGNNLLQFGTNAPRSKMANAGWSVNSVAGASLAGAHDFYFYTSETILFFGKPYYDYSDTFRDAVGETIKAEDAYNIDSKVDDGKPDTGRAFVNTKNTDCVDGSPAAYVLTSPVKACNLAFRFGY